MCIPYTWFLSVCASALLSDQIFQTSSRDALHLRASTSAADVPTPRSSRGASIPILQESAKDDSAQIFQASSGDTLLPGASISSIDALTPRSPSPVRGVTEDVPISKTPANDTPGTKNFVDVHISKPPDPNAYVVAPRLSVRPIQVIQLLLQEDVVYIVITNFDTFV